MKFAEKMASEIKKACGRETPVPQRWMNAHCGNAACKAKGDKAWARQPAWILEGMVLMPPIDIRYSVKSDIGVGSAVVFEKLPWGEESPHVFPQHRSHREDLRKVEEH